MEIMSSLFQEETENNSQDPDANAADNHLEKERYFK